MTGAGRGGKTVPLGHKEPISCDTERGVVVEPAPVATFKVAQPQFLFQLFIIPLMIQRCLTVLIKSLNLVS